MTDEALLMKISAYADGELDAAARSEVEAALALQPELTRRLDALRKLDRAAAQLPVPEMDAGAGKAVWGMIAERIADRPGVAQHGLALEEQVVAHLPSAPHVAEETWADVWSGIRSRISARERVVHAQPAQSWRRKAYWWRPALPLAVAAALLLAVTLGFILNLRQEGPGNGAVPGPTAQNRQLEPPEVLDDRYFMVVRHVPGIEAPVVCFFLKEPEPQDDVNGRGGIWD
jgi:hypothetical protein